LRGIYRQLEGPCQLIGIETILGRVISAMTEHRKDDRTEKVLQSQVTNDRTLHTAPVVPGPQYHLTVHIFYIHIIDLRV
jgi:hypothetical protein